MCKKLWDTSGQFFQALEGWITGKLQTSELGSDESICNSWSIPFIVIVILIIISILVSFRKCT
jgi:hypothetical protein